MTNEEAKEQIVKLCNTLQILPDTPLGEAMTRALDSLDAWDKVKADITETILYYKDWGQIEFKAKYKEEALKEVLDCINRHLKER